MNKEYIKEYVTLEKEHWWFIVRKRILSFFLQKHNTQKNLRILNVGAAGGASSQWLAAFGEVVSLESDPFFVEHLLSIKIDVVNASVTNMPFANETFDLVCAFDIIEHVEDHLAAMRELDRVCKTGGRVCLTVPALNILWSHHDEVNGHFRRYTKASLTGLVLALPSLRLMEIKYFNSLLFLPILMARKFSNMFRPHRIDTMSDFTGFKVRAPISALLQSIFSLEVSLFRSVSFPLGVSLLGIWQKGK